MTTKNATQQQTDLTSMCKNTDVEILTNTNNILKHWKEYFSLPNSEKITATL